MDHPYFCQGPGMTPAGMLIFQFLSGPFGAARLNLEDLMLSEKLEFNAGHEGKIISTFSAR